MNTQKPTPPALPGDPFIKNPKSGQRETVSPGRVLRDRNDQPMLCRNSVEGKAIADAAAKFMGKTVILVHFASKAGRVIEHVGFAVSAEDNGTLPRGGTLAIEAMRFFVQEQRMRNKAKWKALTAPARR